MADRDDENYFSDNDGFDALPVSTLQELEQYALTSTQHEPAIRTKQQYHTAQNASHVARGNPAWQNQQPVSAAGQQSFPEPPSSDYGLDDEDVIDLDEPSMVVEPASGPPKRITIDVEAPYFHSQTQAGAQYYSTQPHHDAPFANAGPQLDVSDLQARVEELERERIALERSLQAAKSATTAKAGEISIVRANHEKATKEYERRIAVMQKLHAEEAARQRAEIEAARKDRETVETNNRFLEHDLRQEAERAKRLKGSAVAGAPVRGSPATTPRKSRSMPHMDGFDDHEIIAISPSKSKKNAETPTRAGNKRKRPTQASPASPLPLHFSQPPTSARAENPQEQDIAMQAPPEPMVHQAQDITTMQRVLNHAPFTGHARTIEAFAQHSFRSEPEKTVSSVFLDRMSLPITIEEEQPMSFRVCRSMLELWARCLEEQHYSFLYLVLDMINFLAELETSAFWVSLIDDFVPLATKTIDLVAVPLAKASTSRASDASVDKVAQAKLEDELCVDFILSMFHRLAISASLKPETIRMLWQKMEFDFVLLMLNKAQPLSQIIQVLQMVASSVLPDSFGNIDKNEEKQPGWESGTIDRITSLLFDVPELPEEKEPYEGWEIASLRLEILSALGAIALQRHGSTALAQHRNAIGRLIRFLDLQVTSLYSISRPPCVETDGPNTSFHKLTVTSVNQTTRLLYQLLHNHADIINLREKLAVIHGGHHKFLVAFTRLAFSEQLVFEAGIEEEVVDAAHEILDAVLSPEEGEAVIKAVETPRGTHGTRASAPG